MTEELHVISRYDLKEVAILTITQESGQCSIKSFPFRAARILAKTLNEAADEVESIAKAKLKK